METKSRLLAKAIPCVKAFDDLQTELTHGMAPYVPDLTIRYVPGVGHWSQQEAPDKTNPILAAWLADEAVPILPGDEQYREAPQEQGIQA